MTSLFTQLGKNIADKWLALLVLPGALYLAVAFAALHLRHAHAVDLGLLTRRVMEWARTPSVTTAGGQVVLLAAISVGAAAAGVVAHGLGTLIERMVLATDSRAWPQPFRAVVERRTRARQKRWDLLVKELDESRHQAARALARRQVHDPHARLDALRRLTRISSERPERPTWSGDRINAVDVRLKRDHNLDLAMIWPYLWLIMPDSQRTEIVDARTAITRASDLGAWALLYLTLTVWWWPAVGIAVTLGIASHQQTRSAAHGFSQALEAAARLNTRRIAADLGLEVTGAASLDIGGQLSAALDPPTSPNTRRR